MNRASIVLGILVAFAWLGAPRIANAQEVELQSLDLLPTDPAPQVVGGKPANPTAWPATFVFRNEHGTGCTATAIGPRTILSAAHCMRNGSQARVATRNRDTTVVCHHHPKYPDDISADFALCVAGADMPRPGDGFEKVNADAALVAIGRKVQLLGYGCLTKGGADLSFGALYEGASSVSHFLPAYPNYVIAVGAAGVCFGDSGGGAFMVTSAGFRRLMAVNSRGDISTNSWLSLTHKPDFMDWAKGWATQHATRICGIHSDAAGCRQ